MNDVSEKSVQEMYFNQYRKMIEKAAWKASRIFRMDVEDLRSQAYLIFCEAIERYDPTKASFSTHLFNRLKTINDYCIIQLRRDKHAELPDGSAIVWWDNFFAFQEAVERLESKSDLSKDAQDILSFILGREWEDVESKVKRVPRFSTVNQIYRNKNWPISRTKKAWSEIKTWWVSSAVYMEA